MSAPLIGVTTFDGEQNERPYAMIQTHYVRAIIGAGGIPIMLPNQLTEAMWKELYPRLDGMLVTVPNSARTMEKHPHAKLCLC